MWYAPGSYVLRLKKYPELFFSMMSLLESIRNMLDMKLLQSDATHSRNDQKYCTMCDVFNIASILDIFTEILYDMRLLQSANTEILS
jgi:hypothetical protein